MSKRIARELEKLLTDADMAEANFSITVQSTDCWVISFLCPAGMIYEGETYALRVRFGPNYPIDSPEVRHQGPPTVFFGF
jgi:ubiquitin-protein ligase